jgi:hypothetical protein
MAAETLVKRFLYQIRTKFYPDNEKGFYQERSLLLRAITHPAHWLKDRGVSLPEAKLEAILNEILRGIMHHGDTGKIGYFSAYLLKAVQAHMKHQGDRYYDEAKALRNIAESALSELTKKQRDRRPDALDPVTAQLADLNQLLRATKPGRKKKPASTGTQLDLF